MSNSDVAGFSASGNPIFRHKAKDKPFEPAGGDGEVLDAMTRHVERHIGKVETVFHELISSMIHVDILMVRPTKSRPFTTLVTCGMSEKPMTVPPNAEEFRYAELMLCLPESWPLDEESWKDETLYWPIRWLKALARLPHEYDTWLGYGHTVPNGDPPEPYAPNTKLCCFVLSYPRLAPEEFISVKVSEDKTIFVYAALPLYPEEITFKLRKGMEPLDLRLDSAGITEKLDLSRANVAPRPWWRRILGTG